MRLRQLRLSPHSAEHSNECLRQRRRQSLSRLAQHGDEHLPLLLLWRPRQLRLAEHGNVWKGVRWVKTAVAGAAVPPTPSRRTRARDAAESP